MFLELSIQLFFFHFFFSVCFFFVSLFFGFFLGGGILWNRISLLLLRAAVINLSLLFSAYFWSFGIVTLTLPSILTCPLPEFLNPPNPSVCLSVSVLGFHASSVLSFPLVYLSEFSLVLTWGKAHVFIFFYKISTSELAFPKFSCSSDEHFSLLFFFFVCIFFFFFLAGGVCIQYSSELVIFYFSKSTEGFIVW